MVDEADKAPLEVVCVLKGLVEDGSMLLSDGRRILSAELADAFEEQTKALLQGGDAAAAATAGDNPLLATAADAASRVIRIHPNFKMIVLANRPGFPVCSPSTATQPQAATIVTNTRTNSTVSWE